MNSTWGKCLVIVATVALLASCDALISPQQRIERARSDLASGQWASADIQLRRAIQKQPQNAEAWLLLARLSLKAADAGDTLSDLDHAVKAGAKGPQVDALRVRAWLAIGRPKALLDAASRHELSIPQRNLNVAMARAYNELQQPQRALALLQPIVARHPDLTEARLAVAEALAREGKLDPALSQIATAIEKDRRSAQAPLMKGRLLEALGEFSKAEVAYELALKRMVPATSLSARAMALAGLTRSELAQGKIAQASKSEALLAKVVPNAPATRLLAARLKLIHGHDLGGISDLERLVADVPGDVKARLILGAAQLSQGELQQAQQNLEEVVRATPYNVEARKLLASVRLKLNRPNEALRVLTPALGEQSIDPQLLALFGTAAKRSSDPGEALKALEDAVKAHPADRSLRLNLAQADLLAGRSRQALELLGGMNESGSADIRRDGLLILAMNAVKGPIAAAAVTEKLLRGHPKNVRLLDVTANFFASQGDLARARSLLDRALVVAPHDRLTELGLARLNLASGNPAAAAGLLHRVLDADPKNMAVRVALASALVREHSFAAAEHLLKSSPGAKSDPELPLALAGVYLANSKPKQANAALDRAMALAPQNAAIASEAGTLLMRANQYDGALARFRKATELAPKNAQYWLNTGKAQLALNQQLAAHDSFERALRIDPEWLPAVTGLTLIDLHSKNYSSAMSRVNEYLKSHPENPDGLVLQAEVEAASGHLSRAALALREAQKHRPSAAVAVRLFQIREAQHKPDPQAPLENWLKLRPGDLTVRMVLGNYYLTANKLKPATAAYEMVVKASPRNVAAVNNLAWAYGKLKDPRALSMAERAYKLAPKSANVLDTYAWILARDNKVRRALPIAEQAAKVSSGAPDIEYHYAYILAHAGHRGEARKVLKKLLARKVKFEQKSAAQKLLATL